MCLALIIAASGAVIWDLTNPDWTLHFDYPQNEKACFPLYVAYGRGSRFGFHPARWSLNDMLFRERWTMEREDFFDNYKGPYNIKVNATVGKGKTTLIFFGTATTKQGKTENYKKAVVLDFVYAPDIENSTELPS